MIHLLAPIEQPELIPAPFFKTRKKGFAIFAQPKDCPPMFLSGFDFTPDILAADFFESEMIANEHRRKLHLWTSGIMKGNGVIVYPSTVKKYPAPFIDKEARAMLQKDLWFWCVRHEIIRSTPVIKMWLVPLGQWSKSPMMAELFRSYSEARKFANEHGCTHNTDVVGTPKKIIASWMALALIGGAIKKTKKRPDTG